ncbi:MAG TPA: carboxylesterase family protein [Terracidiphilus sp.]|nr:carboxylesterase family protein [Terracidiphilus sp.]
MQRCALLFCTFVLAVLSLGMAASVYADPLTVKTAQGKVHGKTINDGKVRAFLGIPYAAPPTGELRWKPPQPPAKWKGTREAVSYGAHCVQGNVFADMVFQDAGESEDCLFLNVFTPANAEGHNKLPVMFWIHGGGYSAGSASEPRHNGDFLPLKGVVLVTINYRLDVFGFLATADLAKEAGGAAGNYGLMDMAAALQWVHANIANFGGDPKNVTIFGESAGSSAVSTLMAAASAQGLFQKAIGESGSAMSTGAPDTLSLAERERHQQDWVASLGVSSLAELRALPATTIAEAARKKGSPRFTAVVDGRFLTEPVAATYAAGKQAHVPLLAGWNRDEQSGLSVGMTAEKWKDYAAQNYGEHAAEFLSLYPGDTDAQAVRSAIDYNSDTFIAFSTWKWIEAQTKTGSAPVYRYHFEQPAPPSKFHPGWFAFHSDDIEYVFGNLDTRPGAEWRPEERKLSDQMMSYWTNFARTGDPNGPGLPLWPRFDKDGTILHLDSEITTGPNSTTRPRYEFLLKWMPPRRPD